MQKEILTVEYCKKEIAPPYRNSFQPIHLVNCILAAVGAFLLGAFFAGLSGENGKMVVTIFSIVGCLPLLIYLYIQFTAPRDAKEREEAELEREKRRQQAVLTIRKKYGKNAILKGMNYQEGATTRDRNAQIGGHKA